MGKGSIICTIVNIMVKEFARISTDILEAVGVGFILLVITFAIVNAAINFFKKEKHSVVVKTFRHRILQGTVLGLEILVAADIIKTAAVDFSYGSIGVLALIIIVRTFLSFTLELEMTGKWPWQQKSEAL